MGINELQLIRLVRGIPILYSRNGGRSSCIAEQKNAAWSNVAQTLGASERACITRWKSLRDRFFKELRQLQVEPKACTAWSLFSHLTFLKEHYKRGQDYSFVESVQYVPKNRRSKKRDIRSDELETDDFITKLISQVKKYPVLYHREYIRDSRKLSLKNEAWKAIAKYLKTNEQHCNRVWNTVRCRFSREYRRIQSSNELSDWRYYDEVKFLEMHIRTSAALENQHSYRAFNRTGSSGDCIIDEINEQIEDDSLDNIVYYDETASDHRITVNPDSTNVNYRKNIDPNGEKIGDEIISSEDEEVPQECYELVIGEHQTPTNEKYVEFQRKSEKLQGTDILENQLPAQQKSKSLSTATAQMFGIMTKVRQVLKESEDCYKAMQIPDNPDNITKIQLYLNALPYDLRNTAQQMMINFLLECQIKDQHYENIEDVPKIIIN